eukprot:2405136-Heterocapsa_arctica.AAC.1
MSGMRNNGQLADQICLSSMLRTTPASGEWTVVRRRRERKGLQWPMDGKRSKGQVQPASAKRTSDRGWGASRDQKGDCE